MQAGVETMIAPRRRRRKSIYVKQNKFYQCLLAALIIVFVIVFAVVIQSMDLPTSHVWKDNILIRMIVETQNFIKQNK